MKRLLILAFAASCSNSAPEPSESLGDLRYSPPSSTWNHRDTKEIGRLISRWMPEENPNKESISIIRTAAQIGVKDAAPDRLMSMLVEAQRVLPAPSVQQPTLTKTKRSLQKVEITADFVPTGLTVSYHRVHAMIVDGDVLIHVLYTARVPDPSLSMFRQVVDSIRRGEG